MNGNGRNTGLVALFSFLIGGAIGAGLAFLMTPQSGKKTRRQLRHFVEDAREQALEYADKLREKVL
ncbi:MAG: YtxH domain-containing protein [Alphaproteobacteria bacterium]|uniref:YtxH domain-containing protein n=1 Tax=Candidatus Nitrobium versatile TaxID=2884831 RepID=A0A953LVF6_9BACT|nr:YtxH domain-containing protein [Candidatus Nitrobium versatile]